MSLCSHDRFMSPQIQMQRRYSLKQHIGFMLRTILLVVHLLFWSSWSFWRQPLAPSSEPTPYVPTQTAASTRAEDAESTFDTISSNEGLTVQDIRLLRPSVVPLSSLVATRSIGWLERALHLLKIVKSSTLRTVAISRDDLRNAVLSLSWWRACAHDIWFVALGASDFDPRRHEGSFQSTELIFAVL